MTTCEKAVSEAVTEHRLPCRKDDDIKNNHYAAPLGEKVLSRLNKNLRKCAKFNATSRRLLVRRSSSEFLLAVLHWYQHEEKIFFNRKKTICIVKFALYQTGYICTEDLKQVDTQILLYHIQRDSSVW